MLRLLFVIVAVVPATIFATTFNTCANGEPQPLRVFIKGCAESPCVLKRGEYFLTDLNFDTPRATDTLTPQIVVALPGAEFVPFELPAEQQNGCDILSNAACPLNADKQVIVRIRIPITDDIPLTEAVMEVSLTDNTGSVIACYSTVMRIEE